MLTNLESFRLFQVTMAAVLVGTLLLLTNDSLVLHLIGFFYMAQAVGMGVFLQVYTER